MHPTTSAPIHKRLRATFFAPHWDNIVVGRARLMEAFDDGTSGDRSSGRSGDVCLALFNKDSRVAASLLPEPSLVRSAGIRVHLATNQEHLRAASLMDTLRLAEHVDGIFYSARLRTGEHFASPVGVHASRRSRLREACRCVRGREPTLHTPCEDR